MLRGQKSRQTGCWCRIKIREREPLEAAKLSDGATGGAEDSIWRAERASVAKPIFLLFVCMEQIQFLEAVGAHSRTESGVWLMASVREFLSLWLSGEKRGGAKARCLRRRLFHLNRPKWAKRFGLFCYIFIVLIANLASAGRQSDDDLCLAQRKQSIWARETQFALIFRIRNKAAPEIHTIWIWMLISRVYRLCAQLSSLSACLTLNAFHYPKLDNRIRVRVCVF